MKLCPQCNTFQPEMLRRCPSCGGLLQSNEVEEKMLCPRCGTEDSDHCGICHICGAKTYPETTIKRMEEPMKNKAINSEQPGEADET